MSLLTRLIMRLGPEESIRLFAYHDKLGHLTIGWGYLLEGPAIATMQKKLGLTEDQTASIVSGAIPITRSQADMLLTYTAGCAITDAGDVVGRDAWLRLPDNAKLVCADMCFNMGPGHLAEFKKMLAALRQDPPDFADAAHEIRNSQAATQNPDRYRDLARLLEGCTEPPAPPEAA